MINASTWAIVPAKPFSEAKSRLGPAISAAGREAVARRLLQRTIEVLMEVAGLDRVLVVSRDKEALELAKSSGAEALVEEGEGLNSALTFAARHATSRGASRILVLHSDLPMLEAADVVALLEAGEAAAVVIAHDRSQAGTNGLLTPAGAIEYAFGPQSYTAHLLLARNAGYEPAIVARPGLAFDVDYPGDLAELEVGATERRRDPPPGDF